MRVWSHFFTIEGSGQLLVYSKNFLNPHFFLYIVKNPLTENQHGNKGKV